MKRHLDLSDLPRRRKGECRWCGVQVSGRRRTWCSDACVREYQIRASAATARAEVQKRDRGVCALCGLDTEAARQSAEAALRQRAPVAEWWATRFRLEFVHQGELLSVRIQFRGYPSVATLPTLWQADHITPVAEGGGACGLDNLRTLCWRCHPRETGALRRRLNRAKTVTA